MDKKIEKEIKELKRIYAGVASFLAVAMIAGALFMPHIPESFFM